VLVEAVVLNDGTVGRVCVQRGVDPDLDMEAIAAARRWFEPGTLDGKPVAVLVTIEFTFAR
jgi:TonB family protein